MAEFYKIEDYDAFLWLAHSRFPTNTPGWWGGAHPFNILDWSVIHNGEITSYGTNKRYLEAWGYQCTMLTDTEVVAYLFDLLIRRHQLPIQLATMALAPPYYDDISQFTSNLREISQTVRITYRSALLNGPFSILVASNRPSPTLIGLTDRKKLRPLIGALSGDENTVYIASEECAIQALNRPIKTVWAPQAGRPMVAQQGIGLISTGKEDIQEIESLSMPLVVKSRK